MTKSQRIRESAVMISSTMPSAKYSCSESPLILAKGNTAIDGLSRERQGSGRHRLIPGCDSEDAHRPYNVLELLLADVIKDEVELARSILLHARGNAHSNGLGQAFEPRRDVDAVAKDVAILDDDVAHVDANAE